MSRSGSESQSQDTVAIAEQNLCNEVCTSLGSDESFGRFMAEHRDIDSTILNRALLELMETAGDEDGRQKIVRLLATEKVNLEARDRHGSTALMKAAGLGFTTTVRMLIEAGCNVNAKNEYDDDTALMAAASNCQLRTIELLLENGALAVERNSDGENALMYLVRDKVESDAYFYRSEEGGDAEGIADGDWDSFIVRALPTLLAAAGVNIEDRDENGYTALSFAAAACYENVINRLLEMGADPLVRAKSLKAEERLLRARQELEAAEEGVTLLLIGAPGANQNAEAVRERAVEEVRGAQVEAEKGALPWHIAHDVSEEIRDPIVIERLKEAAEAKLSEQLESNRKAREFKVKSHLDGLMFVEDVGVVAMCKKNDDGTTNENKLKALINMLGIFDPEVIRKLNSRAVKVAIDADGSEITDRPLEKLIAFLGKEIFSEDEIADMQKPFCNLVHHVFLNKNSKHADGRIVNFAQSTLLIGHGGVPRYFNDYDRDSMLPRYERDSALKLESEILDILFRTVEEEKEKLKRELQDLSVGAEGAAAGTKKAGDAKRRKDDSGAAVATDGDEHDSGIISREMLIDLAGYTRGLVDAGEEDEEIFKDLADYLNGHDHPSDVVAGASAGSVAGQKRGRDDHDASGGGGGGGGAPRVTVAVPAAITVSSPAAPRESGGGR